MTDLSQKHLGINQQLQLFKELLVRQLAVLADVAIVERVIVVETDEDAHHVEFHRHNVRLFAVAKLQLNCKENGKTKLLNIKTTSLHVPAEKVKGFNYSAKGEVSVC